MIQTSSFHQLCVPFYSSLYSVLSLTKTYNNTQSD